MILSGCRTDGVLFLEDIKRYAEVERRRRCRQSDKISGEATPLVGNENLSDLMTDLELITELLTGTVVVCQRIRIIVMVAVERVW